MGCPGTLANFEADDKLSLGTSGTRRGEGPLGRPRRCEGTREDELLGLEPVTRRGESLAADGVGRVALVDADGSPAELSGGQEGRPAAHIGVEHQVAGVCTSFEPAT